jgi:hypothetical protein
MTTWLGRKKLAFIPVHRPNAFPPDEPIPADWPGAILQRVFFDPVPSTGANRSLRAYIQAASSGRADLDAAVMPMQIIDKQDVPVDALEGQFGAQLRGQGFDAAALVMLGQPPTGTSQRGGFWARFDMSEGVGVWAMEFMHCLTDFDDLYPFDGNMGSFDEMACSCGTHPSAYTKAAVSWLDASAIVLHAGHGAAVTYALHAVGLTQPPPSGRVAAVRIGSPVPYLMVEARQKVDQFDANIPSEGVIVYRIQTTDPHGSAQNATAPIRLLTTAALQVGQAFTAGNIKVRVTSALSGGFSITVNDSQSAIGFVTEYEAERVDPDRPPGPNNPMIQTLAIDSMPGFIFTATGGPLYGAVVKNAQDHHRKVEVDYVASGQQSGRIISVKLH